MKKIVLLFILILSISVFSQKKEKTLISINDKNFSVSEFKRVYEKNLDIIDNDESKSVAKNLELFINYNLKVTEAYKNQLDTLLSYKSEIETYKNQLSAPYLVDTTFINQLVKDAYFRTKNEIKAKHILIRLQPEALPKDTLITYNKIFNIRERILNGEKFEEVAALVSEDISAKNDPKTGRKGNGGNLGYFSAFRMVYPFEAAAYNTKVGQISMPFRTQFGYHIIQVDDFRESRGEIDAAHILIRDTTNTGKIKIDSIYTRLNNKENFEDLAKKYSEDLGSKNNGGKLGKFSAGNMVKPFEDVAFGLLEINSFSKPFKTPFGWHIVKLLKKYPVKSFNEMKNELKDKIKKSSRMQLSEKAVVNKLKKQFTITEFDDAKKILDNSNLRVLPKDCLQSTIISVNDKNITQEIFINYIKNRKHLPILILFEMFIDEQIITYYKENLIYSEPEYGYTIKEYEDGLLLFEIMQEKVWNKSSNDSVGLKSYFDDNLSKYTTDNIKNIKGQVISDYQTYLEEKWIADLRRKSKINVNKKELKKLIKYYEKK